MNFKIVLTIILLLWPLKSWVYSDDYRLGYVQSVADDICPEEKFTMMIDNNNLNIIIQGIAFDPSMEQKFVARLKKANLFKNINISADNSKNPSPSNNIQLAQQHNPKDSIEVMPSGVIYNSPIADPKWPRFSAGYSSHQRNLYGRRIFDLSFGENLALIRYKNNSWITELGVQAGLFGLMDISSNPTRLINSDYFVGIGASLVYNKQWQNLIQFSHLSSHLGDEFIISRPNVLSKRINLSYEAIKWFTAYKFDEWLPYIGLGYLMHVDPSYIKPLTFEGGIDFVSSQRVMFETTRFIAGMHIHAWQSNQYRPSFNIRTGLQLENQVWQGRNLQFLINYANGKSRHGQFYKYREHYIGLLIALGT